MRLSIRPPSLSLMIVLLTMLERFVTAPDGAGDKEECSGGEEIRPSTSMCVSFVRWGM